MSAIIDAAIKKMQGFNGFFAAVSFDLPKEFFLSVILFARYNLSDSVVIEYRSGSYGNAALFHKVCGGT